MQRVKNQLEMTAPECRGLTGKGVTVAVLDTGIGRHPDLTGKLLAFRDFVNGRQMMYDDCGHGTHVCGIVCGDGVISNGKYAGMAPGAGLVVGKVLDEQGDGTTEQMLAGLKWIESIYKQYGIRILNISIGIGDLHDGRKEAALREQMELLWDKGITIVCAAGNKGPAGGSISGLGVSRKLITVGCHDGEFCRWNPRRCETYSGRGVALSAIRKPDIVAPGTDIVSCNRFWKRKSGMVIEAYTAKSGTSMATPIIAGAAALTFEKYPDMTNEEWKQKLTFTATDLGEPWNKQGWGMVNIRHLLE